MSDIVDEKQPQGSSSRFSLFGGSKAPWTAVAGDFRAVNDSIRGGSSTSSLVPVIRADGSTFGNFFGHLDTSTLGGAGFASQACTQSFNLDGYSGLELLLIPSPPKTPTSPRHFTLNLKTELGGKRPDGRTQSTVSYEYDFTVPYHGGSVDDEKANGYEELRLTAAWKDFKPTYRGRPAEDAEALDPACIKEIAIMCRSNFDKQSGDFNLYILQIAAYKGHSQQSRISSFFAWLRDWLLSIFASRQRGRGHVRL